MIFISSFSVVVILRSLNRRDNSNQKLLVHSQTLTSESDRVDIFCVLLGPVTCGTIWD